LRTQASTSSSAPSGCAFSLRRQGGELAAQFFGGGREVYRQGGLAGILGDHRLQVAMRFEQDGFPVIPFR
jgi:hypothetical protein